MKEFCDLLLREGKRQFLLGSPTLVDFYFLESTAYMLGIFGGLEGRRPGVRYLRVMHSFHLFMRSQGYYLKNRAYLESFAVVGSRMSPAIVSGISRIWSREDATLSK
jgi:hypothetical protein